MQFGSVAARPQGNGARASAITLCVSCGPIKMYRASVRCTAACGFAMCTKKQELHIVKKEKNKNMLHVDCGAACHVCQEH